MAIGLPADFINGPLKDLGRTARIFAIVKVVSNIEGDETIGPGIVREITCVLYPTAPHVDTQGKDGLYTDGDANLFTKPSDNVQVNDIIEWEGRFYRLGVPVRRYSDESNSTPSYDYTKCKLHEEIPSGPVAGSGRFIGPYRGIPENAALGDWWYDTEDKQYKGYDGTNVVVLG